MATKTRTRQEAIKERKLDELIAAQIPAETDVTDPSLPETSSGRAVPDDAALDALLRDPEARAAAGAAVTTETDTDGKVTTTVQLNGETYVLTEAQLAGVTDAIQLQGLADATPPVDTANGLTYGVTDEGLITDVRPGPRQAEFPGMDFRPQEPTLAQFAAVRAQIRNATSRLARVLSDMTNLKADHKEAKETLESFLRQQNTLEDQQRAVAAYDKKHAGDVQDFLHADDAELAKRAAEAETGPRVSDEEYREFMGEDRPTESATDEEPVGEDADLSDDELLADDADEGE